MSKKDSTALTRMFWIVIALFFIVAAVIADKSTLAERTTYASQEEMQSALQGTYIYYTPYGNLGEWVIEGDHATSIGADGISNNHSITKWNYRRGFISVFSMESKSTGKLYVSKDGSLYKGGSLYGKETVVFQPKAVVVHDTTCNEKNCNEPLVSGGYFCKNHTCMVAQCNLKRLDGGSYCVLHTCQGGSTHCRNWVREYLHRCPECRGVSVTPSESHSTPTYSAPAYQNTPTKTHYYYNEEMPDCDDYESYEDFMDDWDGNMPDGSDAEDYWGNW